MISGHGNIETAVSAIKRGAYDYIEKPFKADRLVLVAERALEASQAPPRGRGAAREAPATPAELIGTSPAMNHLRADDREGRADQQPRHDLRRRRAPARSWWRAPSTSCRAAPTGRSWCSTPPPSRPTGWRRSCSAPRPSNGAARARRRARGGARRHALPRRGRRHAARDAEQDPARAGRPDLHRGSAARRGCSVDVRIISSTGRDLEGEIAEGTFREDLFHRLAVVPLRVPALAERREDIPVLVRPFRRADLAQPPACRRASSATTPWPCCRRTTGRATSASCATTSSG